MHGDATPQLQCLATQVFSEVANTSSAKRCSSTFSFIHNVKVNECKLVRDLGLCSLQLAIVVSLL
jgi:hypothetical protein